MGTKIMNRYLIKTSFFFLFSFAFISCSRSTDITPGVESITFSDLRTVMEYLASDELEGRKPGEDGYRKAAEFSAEWFKNKGLKPGWTDKNGDKSYIQPVPMLRYVYGEGNKLKILEKGREDNFVKEKDFEIIYPGKKEGIIGKGKPVFIGYGIHEPERGWDDYAGLEIRNNYVFIIEGVPLEENGGPRLPEALHKKYTDPKTGELQKLYSLMDKKAAGIIIVPNQWVRNNWERTIFQRKQIDYIPGESYNSGPADPPLPVLLANSNLVNRLFSDMEYNPLTNTGKYKTFEIKNFELELEIDAKRERFDSPNLIAEVVGTGPELKNEYIIVSAHLDHLGRMGSDIYNGANDDASGCAVVLEAAEAVALNPLKCSVIFVLFTSEEAGHTGSVHFLEHPPVPIGNIKTSINIEQIGSKNRNVKGIWAIGPASLKNKFQSANKRSVKMDFKYDYTKSFVDAIRGSDTYSFYLKDIPAVILGSGGFPDWHTPRDKLDLIDYKHLHKSALLLYECIVETGGIN